MTLTRSQKICFGVLAAGLVALVADRSFGGAAAAEPTLSPAPAAAGRAVAEAGVPVPIKPAAAPSLAVRLRRLVPGEAFSDAPPDAFAVPAAWSASGGPSAVDVEAFRAAHALRAVMDRGRDASVLAGDRLIAVGQSIDGYALVEVHERQAVFVGPAGRVTLELPAPTAGR